MTKTDVNTALAIFFLATAVVLIGGLALVPTTMQSASADKGIAGGFPVGGCGTGGCGGDFKDTREDSGITGGFGQGGGFGEGGFGHGDGAGVGQAHCGGGTGVGQGRGGGSGGEVGGGSCDD